MRAVMFYQHVLEFAGLSDTGHVREHNEDAIEICVEAGFAVLADGMGGYNAGEVASQVATSVIKRHLQDKFSSYWNQSFARQSAKIAKWAKDAIVSANDIVMQMSLSDVQYAGMGTTVVVALCYQDKLLVAHVGDSRAYRLRDHHLDQITRDHSVIQEQIDAGLLALENAQYSPIKNLITRAVGVQDEIEVEVHEYQLKQDDIYLLCSDGLTDMLNHDEIALIMNTYANDLAYCCRMLIDKANSHGGRDNISVVLLKVSDLRPRSFIEHFFAR
jgi:serine/threonine protein phosphatase PrpC